MTVWSLAIAEKPEGAKASKTYDAAPDPNSGNTSHALVVDLTGSGKDVLDIGVATGYVARILVDRGCRVTGVELDEEAARQAEQYCEKVIVGDVESMDIGAELRPESFDVIIFGDVLEHLKDPRETLRRMRPLLRPEGYVVASIPNIAHGSVRLALMQGRFEYRPLGLLDDTHLRFFTRESVESLFEDAGFIVGEMTRTTAGVFETEIEVDREAVAQETLAKIAEDPDSETYQFVLSAHPSSYAGKFSTLTNRIRLLEEEMARREEEMDRERAFRDGVIYELNRRVKPQEELHRRLESYARLLAEKEEEAARLRAKAAASENALRAITGRGAVVLAGVLGRLGRSRG